MEQVAYVLYWRRGKRAREWIQVIALHAHFKNIRLACLFSLLPQAAKLCIRSWEGLMIL